MILFRDRTDAGRQLAKRLAEYRGTGAVVLGLARGGVVVAAEVARELDADLEVFVARKVGAPSHPEFGIGAVGPDGARFFDPYVVERLGLSPSELESLAKREEAELQRRIREYRGARPMPDLLDRTAILVDDGLATGVTAVAAAMSLRRLRPRRLIVAVPVCSQQACDLLHKYVDEVVCLEAPEEFYAVGQWYESFDKTSDEEVKAILQSQRGDLA